MRWNEVGELPCSVARALSVVGDPWTLLILRDCFLGVRRFDALQQDLGCSPHTLATRLAALVDHDVLERHRYQQRPARDEYRLTEKGRDLFPVIASLLKWGDRWMADERGAPATFIHQRCGATTDPLLVCSECGDPIETGEIRTRLHFT